MYHEGIPSTPPFPLTAYLCDSPFVENHPVARAPLFDEVRLSPAFVPVPVVDVNPHHFEAVDGLEVHEGQTQRHGIDPAGERDRHRSQHMPATAVATAAATAAATSAAIAVGPAAVSRGVVGWPLVSCGP